jgi:hypothetical protein
MDTFNLEARFHTLASQWREETRVLSSMTEMVQHPAYQEIIRMGWDAVPLLLRELKDRPHHWFWALKEITGEDPVRPEDRGDLQKMREAWLCWSNSHLQKLEPTKARAR